MAEQRMTMPVRGMTCASCVAQVEKALKNVEGIGEVNVNLATEKASLEFRTDGLRASDLVKAVKETGYEIPTETMTLSIGGMTCASCANHVEQALHRVPGVTEAVVNLATEKARVTFIPGTADRATFEKAVADAGYEVVASPERGAATEEEQENEAVRKMREARLRMLVGLLFASPAMLWMLVELFLGTTWPNPIQTYPNQVQLCLQPRPAPRRAAMCCTG